jgi:esterase/lipase
MTQEAELEVQAFDGKSIYCAVDYAVSEQRPAETVIVMVHGVTGYPHNYAFQIASRYFAQQGSDVVRPALYSGGENHRNLSECTTSIHTKDVQSVINALRLRYKKIYVAGHSLAGTSLIGLTHTADAYSFWDCDYLPWDDTWQYAKYEEKLDAYTIGWGSKNLISKDMVEEGRATTEAMIKARLAAINVPSQVIIAEFGQAASGKKIFEGLNSEKELQVLTGSGHVFKEGDSAERLAALTFDWFGRF